LYYLFCEKNFVSQLLLRGVNKSMTQKIEKDAQKFWEGSKSNQFVQDMSHFRGSDRWSDEKWFLVG
jgi:hypothetical protein